MAPISPTAEAFRATWRRPSLTLAEISWRWAAGGTATALFFFGLIEYLDTLPVTSGEALFLRTRHPYLVAEAIAHILRGSLGRGLMALMMGALLLALLWIVAASLGRAATVRGLIDYFRHEASRLSIAGAASDDVSEVPGDAVTNFPALSRLNFLRVTVALAAIASFLGAAIVAGFVSPDRDPRPGLAFLLFLLLAGAIFIAWSSLNWLLSLAGIFAVRDGEDVLGAVSTAVAFCRERIGPVFAVSTWTGVGHLIAFVAATVLASLSLGFAGAVPGRLVLLGILLVTLAYFALADWLYTVRLAGYVCIAELPDELLYPQPPAPPSTAPPGEQLVPAAPLQTTIDRDEPILSDVPNPLPNPITEM